VSIIMTNFLSLNHKDKSLFYYFKGIDHRGW
jgi:hypothetical protein